MIGFTLNRKKREGKYRLYTIDKQTFAVEPQSVELLTDDLLDKQFPGDIFFLYISKWKL